MIPALAHTRALLDTPPPAVIPGQLDLTRKDTVTETIDEQEPWAATRDASWYDRPDVHSAKHVHMAGRLAPGGEGVMSRCGRSLLDDGSTWLPEAVPAGLRCRSNGCRQAWPTP